MRVPSRVVSSSWDGAARRAGPVRIEALADGPLALRSPWAGSAVTANLDCARRGAASARLPGQAHARDRGPSAWSATLAARPVEGSHAAFSWSMRAGDVCRIAPNPTRASSTSSALFSSS